MALQERADTSSDVGVACLFPAGVGKVCQIPSIVAQFGGVGWVQFLSQNEAKIQDASVRLAVTAADRTEVNQINAKRNLLTGWQRIVLTACSLWRTAGIPE